MSGIMSRQVMPLPGEALGIAPLEDKPPLNLPFPKAQVLP